MKTNVNISTIYFQMFLLALIVFLRCLKIIHINSPSNCNVFHPNSNPNHEQTARCQTATIGKITASIAHATELKYLTFQFSTTLLPSE